MRATGLSLFGCLTAGCLLATPAAAQDVVTYEKGADGVTYQVTRRKTQQLLPTTQMQSREEKVLRPQVTTQYQNYQQQYLTPVTEYRWVSRMRGRWNPFVQPYWAQQLEPFTRWESRQSTVQVPTTRTDWVEQRRVVQTPVTTYRTVENETISKVAVSATPATLQPAGPVQSAIVSSPLAPTPSAVGGHRLQQDPPRTASGWQSSGTLIR